MTAPIHCRGSIGEHYALCDAKFIQICFDEEINPSTSWVAWGWVNFQQIYIFGWHIALNIVFWQIFTQNKPFAWFLFLHFTKKSKAFVLTDMRVSTIPLSNKALADWFTAVFPSLALHSETTASNSSHSLIPARTHRHLHVRAAGSATALKKAEFSIQKRLV